MAVPFAYEYSTSTRRCEAEPTMEKDTAYVRCGTRAGVTQSAYVVLYTLAAT